MFLVSDGSRDARKKTISGLAAKDKAVGFLLSVIDFEWTLRRAILMLSTAPTRTIREALATCHGLDAYSKLWKAHVVHNKGNRASVGLAAVVNRAEKRNGNKSPWEQLKAAFGVRHRLVHGVSGFIKDEDAERHMLNVFAATDALAKFVTLNGMDVFEPIKPRKDNKEKK